MSGVIGSVCGMKTSDLLDSSWSHGRAVGVLMTRIGSTGVIQAADTVQQLFKTRKTLAVGLDQKQQKHSSFVISLMLISLILVSLLLIPTLILD